jgi:type II secretory pathway pseudopilin PulG
MAAADAGVTLAELVISIALVSVLGTMVMLTFIQGSKAVFNADARGADTQQAKTATENLAKVLRLAVDPDGAGALRMFEAATSTDATFYAALGNKNSYPAADDPPKKVRVWLDGTGVIRQTVIQPQTSAGVTTWPGSGTTRVVGRDVVTGGLPLMTFLAASDTTTDADGVAVTSLANTAGTLSGATLGAVEAVEIWVSVATSDVHRDRATTAVTRVTMLNIE